MKYVKVFYSNSSFIIADPFIRTTYLHSRYYADNRITTIHDLSRCRGLILDMRNYLLCTIYTYCYILFRRYLHCLAFLLLARANTAIEKPFARARVVHLLNIHRPQIKYATLLNRSWVITHVVLGLRIPAHARPCRIDVILPLAIVSSYFFGRYNRLDSIGVDSWLVLFKLFL